MVKLNPENPRFGDVEAYMPEGDYSVDVRLTYLKEMLEDYEDAYGLDLCPDFQRQRVWTQEQQIAYVEHLLREGESSRTIYFNSPAFGRGVVEGGLDKTVLCVDGLQRLTACLAFLNNEIPVFGFYYKQFTDKISPAVRLRINVSALKTRKEVLTWYLQLNAGGTPHTPEELNRVQQLLEQEN